MSNLKKLIRREIGTQKESLVGMVLKDPRIIDFDGGGGGRFVVPVEVGGNNFLVDVPIKANGAGNRFHAQLGQTVSLHRNAQGRFEITGPGDRLSDPVEEQAYDLASQTSQSTIDLGFTFERVAFDFYETLDGTAPLGVLWADGVTPFNLVRILDAQGNPV